MRPRNRDEHRRQYNYAGIFRKKRKGWSSSINGLMTENGQNGYDAS